MFSNMLSVLVSNRRKATKDCVLAVVSIALCKCPTPTRGQKIRLYAVPGSYSDSVGLESPNFSATFFLKDDQSEEGAGSMTETLRSMPAKNAFSCTRYAIPRWQFRLSGEPGL